MNPTTDRLPPPPQLPLQPPRSSFNCDRHPDENFSGFCPLCLYERLTTLDQSANAAAGSSSSRRNSTSATTAAIKSLFKAPSSSNAVKASFLPELRRTKSFSAAKNDGLGLFASGCEPQRKSCDVRGRNTLLSVDDGDQFHETLAYSGNEEIELSDNKIEEAVNEIEEPDLTNKQLKTMQDHIDLDSHSKKHSRSNFWSAASVLGQKWQKWRRKTKKNVSSFKLPVEKPKSEIPDYGFGRRSIDIDPRFSLDVGRVSYGDPRRSFDEPRASWDGYVIGRTFPRLPPMVEHIPMVPVPRSDMQMSVEQPASTDNIIPGGSTQTREYYTDSSSKRRKSLDRSNSIRKMAAAVVAEMDESHESREMKTTTTAVSNAKVSPATIDYNYSHLGLRFSSIGNERELARDSNASSLRDDCSETFDLGLRDKKDGKKPRRWRWKLWGFSRGSGAGKDEEDRFSRATSVDRSYSESWQETRFNNRLFRSNSTVSCRNASCNTKKSNSEFVLERNRSVKYSPNHTDSGLLRFYLTPLRGIRRSKPISNSNLVSRNDANHNHNRLTIFG